MLKIESALPTVPAADVEARAPQMGESTQQRIFLQQAAQSRFAPPQYYYEASRSGAVPSWAVSGVQMGDANAAPRHYQPAQ
jgi:hypothetical protein